MMDSRRFNAILKDTLAKTTNVLGSKAKEYATEDRLHNFKKAAAFTNRSPVAALSGFLLKHVVSLFDMMENDPNEYTLAQWDEKILDIINYCILLRALVIEANDAPGT